MTKFQFAIIVYGLFMLGLGIAAFVNKHHLPSLLGGGSIGVLEIMLGVYTYKNPRVGFIGASVIALLSALMFIGQSVQAGAIQFYPHLVVITVSLLFVYYLVGGHFSARRKAREAAAKQ